LWCWGYIPIKAKVRGANDGNKIKNKKKKNIFVV
jgi:hypothetical protein